MKKKCFLLIIPFVLALICENEANASNISDGEEIVSINGNEDFIPNGKDELIISKEKKNQEIIKDYYNYIEKENYAELLNLYSGELYNEINVFIRNKENKVNNQGLFNIKRAEVEEIREAMATDSGDYYFVKCKLQVTNPDKYYMEGENYFIFKVANDGIEEITIPSMAKIKEYETDEKTIKDYIKKRNELLYEEDSAVRTLSDKPVSIDYVKNPSKVRVKINGIVQSVNFDSFMLGVAAGEFNNLTYSDGYKVAAMAAKMFVIHKVLSAASGTNYDITDSQISYKPTKTISSQAKSAVEYTKNMFLLDAYGSVFPTFFRTRKSSYPQFCVEEGGILPQIEADAETQKKSWKDVLRYYYTKKSNVTNYNREMREGNLIITTTHTHDWGGGTECRYCGAIAD